MDLDSLYNVMMETILMEMDAVKIVKLKLDIRAMEDHQTVKIRAQKLFQALSLLLHQVNLTYMEKLFLTYS